MGTNELQLNRREHATTLAALRLWQALRAGDITIQEQTGTIYPDRLEHLDGIAADGGRPENGGVEPLNVAEIDRLAQRLNGNVNAARESCAERLPEHLKSRLQTFAGLVKVNNNAEAVAAWIDDASADESGELSIDQLRDISGYYSEADVRGALVGKDGDDLRELVSERFNELPLSLETFRTVKVLLSTGGPADWLEYTVDDTEDATGGEIVGVEYVFQDWFDGARVRLADEDLDTAKEAAEIAGWTEKYD